MDFELSEELKLLKNTVRRFVDEELRPHERQIEETDHFDHDLFCSIRKKAVDLGLYAHNIPEEHGGAGLSMLAQVVVAEELGHTTLALGDTLGYLYESITFATGDQRDWFLKPLVSGEKMLAIAITEPDAGSDVGSIKTRARESGGKWILDGSKQFISDVDIADYIIVIAVTDPSAPIHSRLSAFIVDRNNPGFHYLRSIKTMGWRGYRMGAFSLDGCEVEPDCILGNIGEGFKIAMSTLNGGRATLAGRYVGTAQELLDQGVEYAKSRVTFGQPLSQHQAIQFSLADCDVEIRAARLLAWQAAVSIDQGDHDARIAASRAKLYGSEMAGRVADRVFQIFGAAGWTTDFTIERMYRDARAFRIGEGTSEMQRIQIGRALFKK